MASSRFDLGGRIDARGALIWLNRSDIAAQSSPAPNPVALQADLDDPLWGDLVNLAPNPEDLDDERRLSAGRRDYFLRRRALLRTLVGFYLSVRAVDVRVSYDLNGAPRILSTPSCFVSVSARGSLAGLAAATSPIGLDIELSGDAIEPVWPVLHVSERALLQSLAEEERHAAFLRIWTMKEAYLKALGRGFERDPTDVEISMDAHGHALVRDPCVTFQTRLAEWTSDGDLIAACFVQG